MIQHRSRILIVDDDESLCMSLQSALGDAGFQASSFQDATQALQSLFEGGFDIALVDINLPKLDGISLAREARKHLPNLGVILISGYGTLDKAIQALKAGVHDFLKKPFKIEELLISVQRLSKLIQLQKDLESSTKELRKSEERYRTLIESIADAIALVEEDKVVFHNRALQELLGCVSLLDGKAFSDLIYSEDHENVVQYMKKISNRPNNRQTQFRLRRKDDSFCWVSANTSLIDYQGRPAYLSSFRDITAMVEIENMRKDMERMLRHDMRSQIIAIVGFARRLIENTDLSDNQAEYCRYIRQCGMDLESMIETYLDISKLEQSPFILKKESFNLMEAIKHSRSAFRDFADRKNVSINILFNKRLYSIEDSLPFSGDRIYLQNAFNNLVKNAIEASPKDTAVKIKVNQHPHEISIHNWSTVPEEIRHAFFEKYVTAGKKRGLGLGTYMARLVVDGHGGTITLRSAKDEGTTILIKLPYAVN